MVAPAGQKFCTTCGELIHEKAEICPKCGVRQPIATASTLASGKNRTVAALLAILLGWIGIHKFYLGQNNTGIIYLLFCWTFIPAVLGLIDGIVLLGMTDEAFAAKYS